MEFFKIIITLLFFVSFIYTIYSFSFDKKNKKLVIHIFCLILIVGIAILCIEDNIKDKKDFKEYHSCKSSIFNIYYKNEFVKSQMDFMYENNKHCDESYQNQVICEKIKIEINKNLSPICQKMFSTKDIIDMLIQEKINKLSNLPES